MKLSKCTHGKIVISENNGIGMIVGITNNIPCSSISDRAKEDRAIPLVQWAHGGTFGINAYNIEEYKG